MPLPPPLSYSLSPCLFLFKWHSTRQKMHFMSLCLAPSIKTGQMIELHCLRASHCLEQADKRVQQIKTWANMDEPWRHYAAWNKPNVKGWILYNSTNARYPRIVKFVETANWVMVTRGWRIYCLMGIWVLAGEDGKFWRCIMVMAIQQCKCTVIFWLEDTRTPPPNLGGKRGCVL